MRHWVHSWNQNLSNVVPEPCLHFYQHYCRKEGFVPKATQVPHSHSFLCPTERYTLSNRQIHCPIIFEVIKKQNVVSSLCLPKLLGICGIFWWFLFVCFVLKVKHISICTLSSILTSSSSKRPVPPLKRPPLEPNGVKSSSVSLGGLKMSSSSSRKQERQESWLSFGKGNKETVKTKISLIPPPLSYKHDMYREAAVDLSGCLWLLHNITFKVKLTEPVSGHFLHTHRTT